MLFLRENIIYSSIQLRAFERRRSIVVDNKKFNSRQIYNTWPSSIRENTEQIFQFKRQVQSNKFNKNWLGGVYRRNFNVKHISFSKRGWNRIKTVTLNSSITYVRRKMGKFLYMVLCIYWIKLAPWRLMFVLVVLCMWTVRDAIIWMIFRNIEGGLMCLQSARLNTSADTRMCACSRPGMGDTLFILADVEYTWLEAVHQCTDSIHATIISLALIYWAPFLYK